MVRDAQRVQAVILLLAGTSETAILALGLAESGYDVLVSTATDIPLAVGEHARIQRRAGALDEGGMARLIREKAIRAIVDATHPYAVEVRGLARRLASQLDLPYLTFIRPGEIRDPEGVAVADSHEEAAKIANAFGCAVLLTTGSRHLLPYAREAKKKNVPLYVRVLPEKSSLEACRSAGVDESAIIAVRGPFSVEENQALIRRFGIGVLVMKDSGKAGGTAEKLAAARQEDCRIVMVRRPEQPGGAVYHDTAALIQAVLARIPL